MNKFEENKLNVKTATYVIALGLKMHNQILQVELDNDGNTLIQSNNGTSWKRLIIHHTPDLLNILMDTYKLSTQYIDEHKNWRVWKINESTFTETHISEDLLEAVVLCSYEIILGELEQSHRFPFTDKVLRVLDDNYLEELEVHKPNIKFINGKWQTCSDGYLIAITDKFASGVRELKL